MCSRRACWYVLLGYMMALLFLLKVAAPVLASLAEDISVTVWHSTGESDEEKQETIGEELDDNLQSNYHFQPSGPADPTTHHSFYFCRKLVRHGEQLSPPPELH